MEENTSNESNENEKIVSKDQAKASKDNKKKNKNKAEKKGPGFFDRHKAEFKKIKWPSRKDLFKETVVVIVISLAVGVVIYAIDAVLQYGFSAIL